MNEQEYADKLREKFGAAMPSLKKVGETVQQMTLAFRKFPRVKAHITINKQGQMRIWWLSYGIYIPCHVCQDTPVRIEDVWCGCGKRLPRKLKKWVKGRRAVYKETM